MKRIIFSVTCVIMLASCSTNIKKVLILSRGKATVDLEEKTINVDASTGHEEQTIEFNTAEKVSLKVKSQAGEATIEIPENGFYVINLKADTTLGSYQNYGSVEGRKTSFTQEDVKQQLDSLKQFVANQNVSTAKRNFYLLPNTGVKITDNLDAFVVGPYHQMTSLAKEEGKTPEVYRFYSIKEVREKIEKAEALTGAKKAEEEKKK
ncbi:hypothetical protein [Foetidibacter luteolus]|uniref:hypothetical protein n=1 Tax=Foetidibacter luteolus TaxID=2608880 RepID=UPI00129A3DC5|nr:hypothetical protein [Foetidibacter luteolus]